MMLILLVSAGVFAVSLLLARRFGADSGRLIEPRRGIVTTRVQIICGDCSGESALPVKTYIDRFGNCSQCGGRSYILAASCALNARSMLQSDEPPNPLLPLAGLVKRA